MDIDYKKMVEMYYETDLNILQFCEKHKISYSTFKKAKYLPEMKKKYNAHPKNNRKGRPRSYKGRPSSYKGKEMAVIEPKKDILHIQVEPSTPEPIANISKQCRIVINEFPESTPLESVNKLLELSRG